MTKCLWSEAFTSSHGISRFGIGSNHKAAPHCNPPSHQSSRTNVLPYSASFVLYVGLGVGDGSMNGIATQEDLDLRIKELESQLESARSQSQQREDRHLSNNSSDDPFQDVGNVHIQSIEYLPTKDVAASPQLHSLILLSDSAFPLGSFAYSNGLESFLAHHKPLPPGQTPLSLFKKFLRLSVQSVAHTNLPYVLHAYRHPYLLVDLDNDLDAATPCKVTRAASVAQGRALVGIWERSLVQSIGEQHRGARDELQAFSQRLGASERHLETFPTNGHLAPLWGVVSLAMNQSTYSMAYLFTLNHAKAIASAAVRANVLGPYSAQAVLAGHELQALIKRSLQQAWNVVPEDAGQVVPVMDLWVGRHELLYSRIFNS